ncbi:MAG: ammonium transporter, partial [bacterium]
MAAFNGCLVLWFGWFGFNGGSALASNGQAVFALVNSSVSAATAMVVWIFIEWGHLGKPSLVGSCIGLVAGLATVTPCAGFIRPWAAFLIGTVCA